MKTKHQSCLSCYQNAMYYSIYYVSLYHRLAQLEKLKVLDLGYNPLGEVPEAVYSLSQLTELRLDFCKLSNISNRYVRIKTKKIIPCILVINLQ